MKQQDCTNTITIPQPI